MKKNNKASKDLIYQAKIQGMFVFLFSFPMDKIISIMLIVPSIVLLFM